jgi:hypothetical protein
MSDKKKEKECPFEEMSDTIDTIDIKLMHTKKEIERIARLMKEFPEECPDVIDSEIALQEALDVLFAEELYKNKKGEA